MLAVFDKQSDEKLNAISAVAQHSFETPEHGLEALIINQSAIVALRRYGQSVVEEGFWPPHLHSQAPHAGMPDDDVRATMTTFFKTKKGEGGAADLLAQCSREEMPTHLVAVIAGIGDAIEPKAEPVIKEPPLIDGDANGQVVPESGS